MKEITITGREAGQRFDRWLTRYLPEAGTGFLHKMLRKKNIKLNGKKADGREKLNENDRVAIYFSDETFAKFRGKSPAGQNPEKAFSEKTAGRTSGTAGTAGAEPQKTAGLNQAQRELRAKVRILYSDDDVLIFHKPAGMLTQKAKKDDDSLNDYLKDYCLAQGILTEEELERFHPSAANRLDRNTSGIVLAGISTRGLQNLSEALRNRTAEKYYLCIVKGEVKKNAHIAGYLTKEESSNTVSFHKNRTPGAARIETEYRVLKSTPEASLLKVKLITGKSHQIRSHLAAIGHPVLGDYKYGDRKTNDALKRQEGINYQLLHSYEIILPEDDGIMSALSGLHITDPVPEYFSRVQKKMGLELKRSGGR